MRVGDFVWQGERVVRVESIHDDAERTALLSNGKAHATAYLTIVEVADVFELAGFPVEQGAKIGYIYSFAMTWFYFEETKSHWMQFSGSQMGWIHTTFQYDTLNSHVVDVSRTPVLDAFPHLPSEIRECLL